MYIPVTNEQLTYLVVYVICKEIGLFCVVFLITNSTLLSHTLLLLLYIYLRKCSRTCPSIQLHAHVNIIMIFV